ncbi:MAG: HNH endonuclease [Thiobacillus sp.]
MVPLFKGGGNDDANLQSLCHSCHADKSAKDLGKKHRTRIGVDGFPISPGHHWSK